MTADCAAVTELWRHASQWLQVKGAPLWNADDFSIERTLDAVRSGQLVVGRSGASLAAAMLVTQSDPLFWPEEPDGAAFYIHKLVVARASAGKGWTGAMLDWARDEARQGGIAALRLDCDPRPELIGLYEGHGFLAVDPEPVMRGGFRVMRFEKRVWPR